MIKGKLKVIMLPTGNEIYHDSVNALMFDEHKQLVHANSTTQTNKACVPQHLYFVSNDKIEKDDWAIHTNNEGIRYVFRVSEVSKLPLTNDILLYNEDGAFFVPFCCAKIEATTDFLPAKYPSYALPQIPKLFVEKYIEFKGGIREVQVEYEEYIPADSNEDLNYKGYETLSKLKLNTDNTVIVNEIIISYENKNHVTKSNETIEFAKWLKNTDNGTEHHNYTTNELSASISFSPYDCFIDNIMTIEELYEFYKNKCV